MRAITIAEPGGPEVLELTEQPDPRPGPGEVLLEITATAVNRADLVALMRNGVRRGRIVTLLPEHRRRRAPGSREHYVYRRAGLPCLVCGTPVATAVLGGRNLYWCPYCQRPPGT